MQRYSRQMSSRLQECLDSTSCWLLDLGSCELVEALIVALIRHRQREHRLQLELGHAMYLSSAITSIWGSSWHGML